LSDFAKILAAINLEGFTKTWEASFPSEHREMDGRWNFQYWRGEYFSLPASAGGRENREKKIILTKPAPKNKNKKPLNCIKKNRIG